MYLFTTASGTRYKVHNGRITRVSDKPLVTHDGKPDPRSIIGQVVTFARAPQVGRTCIFYTPQMSEGVTTCQVMEIVR